MMPQLRLNPYEMFKLSLMKIKYIKIYIKTLDSKAIYGGTDEATDHPLFYRKRRRVR